MDSMGRQDGEVVLLRRYDKLADLISNGSFDDLFPGFG